MLWRHGFFWDYGGVPPATQVFWASLTFVDPTGVVLVVLWPAAGVWLTLAIIVSDVAHNTWFGLIHGMTADWMYYSQVAMPAISQQPPSSRRASSDCQSRRPSAMR